MFKVGDKVRVKAGVKQPHYGWGRVKPDEVGVIIERGFYGQKYFHVDFPSHEDWAAHGDEMELVEDGAKARKPFTAKDIHNRPVYAELKRSAVDDRTLTKLVKAYLANLDKQLDAREKFELRTSKVIASFHWANSVEGSELWQVVSSGRPVRFEDIKPKVAKKVVVPEVLQAPQEEEKAMEVPKVGRGERPEGATHWNEHYGRWLKVAADGLVSWWSYGEGNWLVYQEHHVGRARVRDAVPLVVVAADFEALEQKLIKRAQPKPVVEEAKKPAPRIGWWD